MNHRASSHNFMFKYAPLRLRGVNQPSPTRNLSASPLPFSPRISQTTGNPGPRMPLTSSTTAEFETTSSSSVDILNSSLDNITNWCQRQERRNGEIQAQLEVSAAEIERLKSQLDSSSVEIEQLRYINQKLKESHRDLDAELQDVNRLYNEVKTTLIDTATILEDISKDKKSWLSNFEELLRKNYAGKSKQMQTNFDQIIEEKVTLIDSMRQDADQILIQLRDATNERDHLKEKLTETMSKLDCITEENKKIDQERTKFETEWIQLKNSFDLMLNEKTAQVIEESVQEKIKNLATVQELNELRGKWTTIQTEFQTATSQLQQMKQMDREEPRDLLKAEIVSSRNQIKQLNAANDAKDTELNGLRVKLASNQDALATYEDVKHSLNILSKEMEVQQERYKQLEKQSDLTNEELVKCASQRDQLETNLNGFKKLFDEECDKNHKLETKIQELDQQLANSKQMVEEYRNKVEDLVNQLANSENKNHQLQEALQDKIRNLEEKVALEEHSQRIKADLDKEVADLKCQLTSKTIELQYREKRMEETERALNELTLRQSENSGQGESIRSEADAPKPKGKTEIEKLKTALNLKNLELESVNDQLKDAQQMVGSAERKITDLELTVNMLEQKLELERKQAYVSFEANPEPTHQEMTEKLPTEKLVDDTLETLTLLQKANAIAKAAEFKRHCSDSSLPLMKKPSSPPTLLIKPPGKKRRLDKDYTSREHPIKTDLRDSVPESPVIRNKSGVLTSRFLDRSRSAESLSGDEPNPKDINN